MSDIGDSDFSPGDVTPQTVQAPDITPDIDINPDDPVFQAPSIMGGLNFSDSGLPMRGQGQAVPQASDRAGGISTALGAAGTIVDGTHGVIRQIGQIVANGDPVLKGLKGVTTAITAPLTIGSGVADTVGQIHRGASPGAAILGNGLRTAAVLGAGTVGEMLGGPLGAVGASAAAGRYLPDGTAIGNDVINLFK